MEFGIALVPFSYCIQYYNLAILFLISYIFLIAIVIVYFDYMSRIVGLILLNPCNCSYSVYPIYGWVDGRQYVDMRGQYYSYLSMVSRYLVYLRGHPDVLGRVVVCAGDSCVGSSVVHPSYVGLAWARSRRRWRLHLKTLISWCLFACDCDIGLT